MDEYRFDWCDGNSMDDCITGGVPIPRPSLGGHIPTNTSILARALHPSTSLSSSIPSSVSANNQFLGGQNSPFIQQSVSPSSYQANSSAQFPPHQNPPVNYSDNIGLSPLPPNSPSPHMWQTQTMDLDMDLDIKMEPFEELLSMEGPFRDNFSTINNIMDGGGFSQSNNSMAPNHYFDDLVSESALNDTTCLDPQHSSPAAMCAVKPSDIMGVGHMTAPNTSSSFSTISQLLLHSDEAQQHLQHQLQQHQQQQQNPQQHQQVSQSLTTNTFLRDHMRDECNPYSGNSSEGGSNFVQHFPVKVEAEESPNNHAATVVVSSFPPPGWRDPFLSNMSSSSSPLPPVTKQETPPPTVVNSNLAASSTSNNVIRAAGYSSNRQQRLATTELVYELLQKDLNQQQIQQSSQNNAMQTDSQQQSNQQILQHQQQQRLQQLLLEHRTPPQQEHIMSQTQQHTPVQQVQQILEYDDQFNKAAKPMPQQVQNLQQKTQQLQYQQLLQQRQQLLQQQQLLQLQKQHPKHQISPNQHQTILKDMLGLSSIPNTPNNTPVQSCFVGGGGSTLKEMLMQSPSTSLSSPISPQSACSPLGATSPLPICSPVTAPSPLNAPSPIPMQGGSEGFDDISYGSLAESVSQVSFLSPMYSQQHSPQYIQSSGAPPARLSSSAPAHNMVDQIWGRREPRKHLISTGSLAEEQHGGSGSSLTNSLLSPAPNELSIDESGLESDEESEIENEHYDSDSDNESLMTLDSSSIAASASGISSSSKKERHFWQYNVQAKGPKGQRVSVEPHFTDPHQLVTVADPVFSPTCSLQGIKHSGKARRGDGNDLSPNPPKLVSIGKQLNSLNKMITEMTPVSEQPFHVRPKSRKEKNKLASRACRLKKKAQHEANKIKLYGLGEEHKTLLLHVQECRNLLYSKVQLRQQQEFSDGDADQQQITDRVRSTITNRPFQIAGQTADFVNSVIAKCRGGRSNGGLDDLANCMNNLRTNSAPSEGGGSSAQHGDITDYMAEFD